MQITAHPSGDLKIPGETFTFGLLKDAQSLGDYQSLAQRHRRAVRLELGSNVEAGLRALLAVVQKVAAVQTSAA